VAIGVAVKLIHSALVDDVQDVAELPELKATTWAADFGVSATEILKRSGSGHTLPNGIRLGLAIQNLGPHLTYVEGGSENPLPLNFRLGLGVDAYQNEFHRVTLAAEMNKVLIHQTGDGLAFDVDPGWKALFTAWTDESLSEELRDAIFNAGAEYALKEVIFLRTGWIHDQTGEITDYTLGGGLRYQHRGVSVQFDYATTPQPTGMDRAQRFSLTAAVLI
jgi:hypothetical protein